MPGLRRACWCAKIVPPGWCCINRITRCAVIIAAVKNPFRKNVTTAVRRINSHPRVRAWNASRKRLRHSGPRRAWRFYQAIMKKRWRRIYRIWPEHKLDIVVGTQLLAKGHHFPNLTLCRRGVMAIWACKARIRAHPNAPINCCIRFPGGQGGPNCRVKFFIQSHQPEHPRAASLAARATVMAFLQMEIAPAPGCGPATLWPPGCYYFGSTQGRFFAGNLVVILRVMRPRLTAFVFSAPRPRRSVNSVANIVCVLLLWRHRI